MKKSNFIRPIVSILVFGFFAMNSSLTEARIFYVSPFGDDAGMGTKFSPWLTMQKAAITLTAGDTVFIMSGTYSEHVIPQQSGTPALPIVYMAYPGHSPIIVGQGKIAGGRVGSNAAQECLTISITDHFIVSNNHIMMRKSVHLEKVLILARLNFLNEDKPYPPVTTEPLR
jgi:hypothetical protein